jgi:hypothetical protein
MGMAGEHARFRASRVVVTAQEERLQDILRPDVQAVVYDPPERPAWMMDLAATVRSGALQFPRTIVDDITAGALADWLRASFSTAAIGADARAAVCDDVLALAGRIAAWTSATRFMVRILTDVPSRHCGFHIDTVAPGASPWGLLRVYNGAGTQYVLPDNVTTMKEFYRYLSRRERLARDIEEAHRSGDAGAERALDREMRGLDKTLPFLRSPNDVLTAPSGAIVAFKHLDASLHWSNHDRGLAWIHASPMQGDRRFVVNVLPRLTPPGSGRSARRPPVPC